MTPVSTNIFEGLLKVRPPRLNIVQQQRARQKGHVLPRAPIISLTQPGRLKTAHVLALCSISHSTLYVRQAQGLFPKPDGKDGATNFWKTETIREFLESDTAAAACGVALQSVATEA